MTISQFYNNHIQAGTLASIPRYGRAQTGVKLAHRKQKRREAEARNIHYAHSRSPQGFSERNLLEVKVRLDTKAFKRVYEHAQFGHGPQLIDSDYLLDQHLDADWTMQDVSDA